MLFFNANFICYYFYPTKKREEPKYSGPKHQLNDKNNEYLSGCIFPVPITVIPQTL